jgi:Beta-propeller repeat/Abnormal spindle-like microcephaly-assoc'd, ASPM-SPD-2-Hydin
MRTRNVTRVILSFMLTAMAAFAQQTLEQLPSSVGTSLSVGSNWNYGKVSSVFEANQGQADPQVKFMFRGEGYTAFLTSGSMVLSLRPTNLALIPKTGDVPSTDLPRVSSTTMQFRLSGAAQSPAVIGEDQKPGRVNYFIGKDPTKWRTNVPIYARIRYKNVYPGIDLVYHGSGRQIECDFAVSPGANPNRIQFEITGANEIRVDAMGNLLLKTNNGELHFESPVVYQESKGQRVVVDGGYVVNDPTHITFHIADYDPAKPLVIDPVLVYSTYLGGSGTDQPAGIAVDSTGSVYIAGTTNSPDFPLATLGSLPTGVDHVFVAKLDPTGSNLVYSDYIGGSSQDFGYALTLDSANNVYVTGNTRSTDFPVVNPYQAALPGVYNGFLTKISANGSALLYSTYLGGNAYDQPSSIAINSAGEVYVAGFASSLNFPTANAYQPTVSPNEGGFYGVYGFVTKFSADGSSLAYSTYLAGNSNVPTCAQGTCWPRPFSLIYGIAVDSNDNAYVTGNTNTYNFPATPGAYLTTDFAPLDTMISFVSKFSSSGSLVYSTYLYGASGASAQTAAIAVDSSGSAYVTGEAPSDGTFPITSTTICDPSVYFGGCSYAFVTKFDPTGSTLQYSTFLSPYNGGFPHAIALDQNNDAYVLCLTSSTGFSILNGIELYTSPADLLVAEIDPVASTELFGSYLGGSIAEYPAGIAVDSSGSIYIGGQTLSTDFPVTSAALQDTLAGAANAFVLKIGPNSAPAFTVTPALLQYSIQQVGTTSTPQTALLRNMGSSPLSISSITVNGDFAETDNCGSSVPAAASCMFSVTFTPTGAWTRSGSIQVHDDAAGPPHTINLSGIGSGGTAGLAPISLVFSAQPVGTSSAAQNVTLTNSGNAALNIISIQATGDYAQTNTCPATLAPSSGCTVSVTFTPTASGTRSGTLTINDDAYGTPQIVNLTGTGSAPSAPIATLTPISLVFPGQPVGTSSTAQPISLTNTGNATLNLGNIQTTGDFAQINNCPATLAPNTSCTINVTFTPKLTGTRNGTLTISDNAQGSPQTVNLTGTGSAPSAPIATLTPISLVFPGQPVGTYSTAQPVSLTNTGNATLNLGNIQTTGDFAQINNCPATLAPNTSCTINVTFTPTLNGTRNGTLTISDNTQGSPQTVNLTGTGSAFSAPIATLTPTSLVFLGQPVGTSSTVQAVTLTNTGNATLNITKIQLTGDYAQTNTCPATLAASANCAINVTFTPTASETRIGTLTISDNVQGSPQVVTIAGTGADFSLASSPGSDTLKAGATANYQLTVSPVANAFTNIVKMSCSGTPALSACSISPNSVTPNGSSATAILTITTTASVAQSISLRSSHDGLAYAIWMPLQGIGLFGVILAGAGARSRKLRVFFPSLLIGMALVFLVGCAGGTGIARQTGTTPGTYTITVSGTSGSLKHSVPVSLVVQ